MPAYAYPIVIKRHKLRVSHDETVKIEEARLTLAVLKFVGDDPFYVRDDEHYGGYVITVCRSRLETDEERDARVAREEAYMAEYSKRKAGQFAAARGQKEGAK